jgi:hypothetical protein
MSLPTYTYTQYRHDIYGRTWHKGGVCDLRLVKYIITAEAGSHAGD